MPKPSAGGFNLFLCDTNRKADFEKDYVRILMEHRACGIIVAPVGKRGEPYTRPREGEAFPVLFIGGKVNDEMDNYVATDNRLGSQLAIGHLASLGHRKIAMICDNYGTKTKQDRIAGVRGGDVGARARTEAHSGGGRPSRRLGIRLFLDALPG